MTTDPRDVGHAVERSAHRLRGSLATDPLLEARMVVEHVIGHPRAWVISHPDQALDEATDRQIEQLVDRRLVNEPLAYILRRREFYGLDLYVDPRVLVPRPETEVLVEEALRIAADYPASLHIVDVGTGSGAIALALASRLPSARLTAVDFSRDALDVASDNAERLGLSGRVELVQGDVLTWLGRPVDLIVANLPYIPAESVLKLSPEVRDFEPHVALDGGPGGMSYNAQLLQSLPQTLTPGGHALMECEPQQIEALHMLSRQCLVGADIDFIVDGFGHARVFHVNMPS